LKEKNQKNKPFHRVAKQHLAMSCEAIFSCSQSEFLRCEASFVCRRRNSALKNPKNLLTTLFNYDLIANAVKKLAKSFWFFMLFTLKL